MTARHFGGCGGSRIPTLGLQDQCAPVKHYAPETWCPVRLGIPGPLVCRTSAHDPSELTGQILVRATRLELAPRGLRGRYSATRIPPALELALRIGLRSVAYQATALPLSYASLEALVRFEPTTCSFGESCACPLRYRAKNFWGD